MSERRRRKKRTRSFEVFEASISSFFMLFLVRFQSTGSLVDVFFALLLEAERGEGPEKRRARLSFFQIKCSLSDDFFFSFRFTFVLHPPLQLDDDHLARELVQERLRVDGHGGLGVWFG